MNSQHNFLPNNLEFAHISHISLHTAMQLYNNMHLGQNSLLLILTVILSISETLQKLVFRFFNNPR